MAHSTQVWNINRLFNYIKANTFLIPENAGNVPSNGKYIYEDTTIDARSFLPVHLVRFGTFRYVLVRRHAASDFSIWSYPKRGIVVVVSSALGSTGVRALLSRLYTRFRVSGYIAEILSSTWRPPATQRRRPRRGVRSQARRHLPLPPHGGRWLPNSRAMPGTVGG
jgi:hypothetical protein